MKRLTIFRMCCGAVAVLFYILYAVRYYSLNESYNLFWACHVGCLLVGFGLLIRSATINAIGLIWISIGIPLWCINLVSGSHSLIFSFLTHWGGLLLGILGVRLLGLKPYSWIKAPAALIVFAAFSRFVTPARENINLAYSIWSGWDNIFVYYPVFILVVLLYALSIAFFMQKILMRFLVRFANYR